MQVSVKVDLILDASAHLGNRDSIDYLYAFICFSKLERQVRRNEQSVE